MFSSKIRAVLATLCSIVMIGQMAGAAVGDEIVIDNQENSQRSLGDFQCFSCPTQVNSVADLLSLSQSGEVSAGELWRRFHSQGIDSLDQLTFVLDVDQLDGQSAFDLQSLQLKIEDQDPLSQGESYSLGENNSIVVPGFETSSFRPEAKLKIDLGYDFMKRFSADSQEKIQLDFSTSDSAPNVKFSIEGSEDSAFSSWNYWLLAGFVGFWIVVFFVLNRVTKRMADENSEHDGLSPQPSAQPRNGSRPTDRALSA